MLEDNDPIDNYRYMLCVCTGHRMGAATSSQVNMHVPLTSKVRTQIIKRAFSCKSRIQEFLLGGLNAACKPITACATEVFKQR